MTVSLDRDLETSEPKVLVARTRGSPDHNTRIIGGDDAIELDLLEQRSFENSLSMHPYAINNVSEASSC